MKSTITTDELTMLLQGLASEPGTSADLNTELSEDEIAPYDITHSNHITRGRMPGLEAVHDRFARVFSQTLTGEARRSVRIVRGGIELLNFRDFIDSVSYPSALGVFRMAPLRGSALLVMEQRLVHTLIDLMFGGNGQLIADHMKQRVHRDFTGIEMRVLNKLMQKSMVDLNDAWKLLTPLNIRLDRLETNPAFASIVPDTETIIVTTFDVEVQRSPMTLRVGIPAILLEPVRSRLEASYQSVETEVNEVNVSWLTEHIQNADAEMLALLGKRNITLRQFLKLKVGDLIPLNQEVEKPLNVLLQGVPKLTGIQGAYKGRKAIQIRKSLQDDA